MSNLVASLMCVMVFLVGCSRSGCEGGRADGGRGADVPACQSWRPASSPEQNGVRSLGPRGAVTTTGTARIDAGDPCVTNVVLAAGRVDVRADDLGGGVLRVEAGPVRFEVRGAQFSVTRDGPRVGVAVTEGQVAVTNSGDPEIELRPGERWSTGGDAPPDEHPIW